jgi:xanthine dehydrogenase large subunit
VQPNIDAPATPERVLWGCEQMRQALAAAQPAEVEVETVTH